MSEFDKDDYLRDMPDADSLAGNSGESASPESAARPDAGGESKDTKAAPASAIDDQTQTAADEEAADSEQDGLTDLGKAKQEAAGYLDALQRERAEFINFRNRTVKEQDRFRQHGIIDVLTALLPALDDIDRIRQHGEMDESFQAVSAKIDKTFEKFGVEKFGEAGEDFDPTKHEAILHKPDADAKKDTVDTVVESGYRIGDRVIRAARVVVASAQGAEAQG
jgi:molecular chaperone GrpE